MSVISLSAVLTHFVPVKGGVAENSGSVLLTINSFHIHMLYGYAMLL